MPGGRPIVISLLVDLLVGGRDNDIAAAARPAAPFLRFFLPSAAPLARSPSLCRPSAGTNDNPSARRRASFRAMFLISCRRRRRCLPPAL